jgi:uroporphyrinogen III methyltransferase / synthase
VACIGPITARTAEEYGLTVRIMPAENTVPALAEMIMKYFMKGHTSSFLHAVRTA